MSFSDNKITAEMLNGKGVVGMPNTPDLPASEMQRKFDELALEVIVPAYNELCDALEEGSAEQGETISGISEKVNENTDNIVKLETAKQDKLTAIEPLSIEETEEGTNELKVDLSEYAKTEDIPTISVTPITTSGTHIADITAQRTHSRICTNENKDGPYRNGRSVKGASGGDAAKDSENREGRHAEIHGCHRRISRRILPFHAVEHTCKQCHALLVVERLCYEEHNKSNRAKDVRRLC